jgi:tetratricopeptide (TPR) repeat protein
MLEPHTASLLVDYFDAFLRDQDIEAFRLSVSSRYEEGTLARLAQSGGTKAKRAAVLALGLVGSYGANEVVARRLADHDPVVRNLAGNALWAIWFRADSPENNATLEQVRDLNSRNRPQEALELASRLIEKAPNFAEAYNQRAIAEFNLGDFAASAEDCRKVLERNPYHIGALAGLAKCCVELGLRDEAIAAFRRSLKLQPFDADLKRVISILESSDR